MLGLTLLPALALLGFAGLIDSGSDDDDTNDDMQDVAEPEVTDPQIATQQAPTALIWSRARARMMTSTRLAVTTL